MLKVKGTLKEYEKGERKTFQMIKELRESEKNGKTNNYTIGVLDGMKLALTNFGHEWNQLEDKNIIELWASNFK